MGYFDDMFKEDPLIENVDYYMDPRGFRIMTSEYHKKRGYCCSNGCKHCPYSPKHIKGNRELDEKFK